ncbi:Transcriptional regulator [Streptomyces venezuelae]|uniref:AraC family transcriptional regulator n=1 Tax=Streptomyces gardneri TaxID=66892 RepID=UPI0006E354C3|nr:Transcriptional regulator [Streptomyces venezuelae]
MHRDPAAPWTVAELAAEAGLPRAPFAKRFALLSYTSEFAFAHAFKRTHGTPPGAYRRKS